jgi:hypothetical protein
MEAVAIFLMAEMPDFMVHHQLLIRHIQEVINLWFPFQINTMDMAGIMISAPLVRAWWIMPVDLVEVTVRHTQEQLDMTGQQGSTLHLVHPVGQLEIKSLSEM